MILLRILLLIFLLYIAWRVLRNMVWETVKKELLTKAHQEDDTVEDILVEDPICHTLILKEKAIRLRHKGKTYYFCSDSCCDQFTGEPGGKE